MSSPSTTVPGVVMSRSPWWTRRSVPRGTPVVPWPGYADRAPRALLPPPPAVVVGDDSDGVEVVGLGAGTVVAGDVDVDVVGFGAVVAGVLDGVPVRVAEGVGATVGPPPAAGRSMTSRPVKATWSGAVAPAER